MQIEFLSFRPFSVRVKAVTYLFMALSIFFGLIGGSFAAEITCLHMPGLRCTEALLRGQIKNGDFQLVLRFIAKNSPELGVFDLDSPGGDVDEALKIGRLFRKYLMATTAPTRLRDGSSYFALVEKECSGNNCGVCASACALVWFGGVDRGGTVGLHRPTTDNRSFGQLSAADASAQYHRWKQDIFSYLVEMEVPGSIIELTDTIGSDEVKWADSIDDRLDHPPSVAEWVKASCPQESGAEIVRRFNKLPESMRSVARSRATCEADLLYEGRTRLPPPVVHDER